MVSANEVVVSRAKFAIFASACVFLMASFIFQSLPGEIDPAVFNISPPMAIPASAKVSYELSKLKKIPLGNNIAPTSTVVINGTIYTGVHESKILKINESGIHEFAILHQPNCTSKPECGQPNGIRLSPDENNLIIADAYLGLFSVSLIDEQVRKLYPVSNDVNVTYLSHFDFLPNGSVIISESSVKYQKLQVLNDLLEGRPNGRLLVIDLETGAWHQALDNLYCPTGVQMHADGRSVLVAETTTYRVLRVPLDGSSPSVFIDGLPGSPCGIRSSRRGGYWVPVSHLRDSWIVRLADWGSQHPSVRAALLKISLLPMFDFIQRTTSSALLRFDDDGVLVEAVLDPENQSPNIVEATEVDDQIFTSSYFLPFIGHLQLGSKTDNPVATGSSEVPCW